MVKILLIVDYIAFIIISGACLLRVIVRGLKLYIMGKKRITVEEVIKQRALFEELRQLRNLRRNLETGIVFDISPELWNVLLNRDSDKL